MARCGRGRWAWLLGMALVLAAAGPLRAEDDSVSYMFMVSAPPEVSYMFMNSPPTAPVSTADSIVDPASLSGVTVILEGAPTSRWTFGCSATSAGMIFGYYDRHGFANMYTGPANGGVAPLTELGQGVPTDAGYPFAGSCSIIATKNGFDGRVTNGHVDDYWTGYGNPGPDPFEGVRAEHAWGNCTADYMGTNQWKWDLNLNGARDANTDGATTFWSYTSYGGKLYDYIPGPEYGLPQTELCHGMRLFAESRGYTVVENYTQLIDTVATGGFSFQDYMNEIDNGCPVMIQVEGHSMVGVGYYEDSQIIYLHDTWDNWVHSMTWGTSYAGMAQRAVTVIHITPEPATLAFLTLGCGLTLLRRRRAAA